MYKNNNFILQKFDIIKIKSLTPWNEIFKPTSFSVLFSFDRIFNDKKLLFLETNGGITYKNNHFSFYSLIGPKALFYKNNKNGNFIFGINFLNGVYGNYKYIRVLSEIKYNFFARNEYNYYELLGEIDINPTKNKNLSLNLQYKKFVYSDILYKDYSEISFHIKKFF